MGDGYDRALRGARSRRRVDQGRRSRPRTPSSTWDRWSAGAQQERVSGFVDRARGYGAEIAAGGETFGDRGFFYRPSLVTGVEQDAEIVQSEVFGPVVTVQRFGDEEEGIRWANGVPVRAGGIGLDEGREARAARGEGPALRHGVDQRPPHDRVRDAARRLRPVRLRQGHELATCIEDYTIIKQRDGEDRRLGPIRTDRQRCGVHGDHSSLDRDLSVRWKTSSPSSPT